MKNAAVKIHVCFQFFWESLGHMATLCLPFPSFEKLPSCFPPFYIPTGEVQGPHFSTFPPALTFFLILAILTSVKRHLLLVLISIFLVTNDVEHLSTCLVAMRISSLDKCVFQPFAHLK